MPFKTEYNELTCALSIEWVIKNPHQLEEPLESPKFSHPKSHGVQWYISLDPPTTNHLEGFFGLYLHIDNPHLVCDIHLGYHGDHGRCFTASVDSDGYGDTKFMDEADVDLTEPLVINCVLNVLSELEERVESELESDDESFEEIGPRARGVFAQFKSENFDHGRCIL